MSYEQDLQSLEVPAWKQSEAGAAHAAEGNGPEDSGSSDTHHFNTATHRSMPYASLCEHRLFLAILHACLLGLVAQPFGVPEHYCVQVRT